MENIVDIIYPIGKGSKWNNNELKYSLRSLEKHGKSLGRVFITGDCPDFLSDEIVHTPCEDSYSYGVINTNEKILHTLRSHDVSDNFVFMNDDFFLLKDVDLSTYPYYYKRMLKPEEEKKKYGNSLVFTYYYLIFQEKSVKNFELHLPIVFNKQNFLSLEKEWSLSKKLPLGLQTRSIYCNMLSIDGIKTRDCKIRDFSDPKDVWDVIEPRDCFSIADTAISCGIESILSELYPKKSKYEK